MQIILISFDNINIKITLESHLSSFLCSSHPPVFKLYEIRNKTVIEIEYQRGNSSNDLSRILLIHVKTTLKKKMKEYEEEIRE